MPPPTPPTEPLPVPVNDPPAEPVQPPMIVAGGIRGAGGMADAWTLQRGRSWELHEN